VFSLPTLGMSQGAANPAASCLLDGASDPLEDSCTKERNLPTSHTEDHVHEADPHFYDRS
jgi:hypothetical protein